MYTYMFVIQFFSIVYNYMQIYCLYVYNSYVYIHTYVMLFFSVYYYCPHSICIYYKNINVKYIDYYICI